MEAEKILIVDDEEGVRQIVSRMLETQGFQTETVDGPESALKALPKFAPDLVLTDIKMPGMDGVELARRVKQASPNTSLIMITGYASVDSAIESLKLGVEDYIKKPIEMEQLIAAVRGALDKRTTTLRNRKYVETLQAKLVQGEQKPQASFLGAVKGLFGTASETARRGILDTVESLAIAMGAKDPVTKDHSRKVGAYVARMAESLSYPPETVRQFRLAGLLHDVGKIGIPEEILLKDEEEMSTEELHIFREHPVISSRILQPVREFEPIINAVRHHHERFDGKGYPDRLSGEHIPIGARLIAVADSFSKIDACVAHDDAVHEAFAIERLMVERGKIFDPEIVDVFIQVLPSVRTPVAPGADLHDIGKMAM